MTMESEKKRGEEFSSIDLEKLKEEKTISEDKLKLIEASIKGLEVDKGLLQNTKPIEKTEAKLDLSKEMKDSLQIQFEAILPKWIDKPWMYVSPKSTDPKLKSWLDEWSNLILDYTKHFVIHIVNVNELRSVYPFVNKKVNKDLTIEQIRDLIDFLETNNFAEWTKDKEGFFALLFAKLFRLPLTNKVRARIYWRTKEEFAEDMLSFMIDTGRVVEVHSLYDLTQFDDQIWASLPAKDLVEVCNVLVSRKMAYWLNREKTIIAFEATQVF